MFAENKSATKRNDADLNDLPSELYTIEADGKIPDNCKYPLATTEAVQNQKQRNTGLSKLLKGCVCYIFAGLFCMSIRERLRNKEKFFSL